MNRRIIVLAAVAGLVGVWQGSSADVGEHLRARTISIVDDNGRERIRIGRPTGSDVSPDVSGIAVFTPDGKQNIWAGTFADNTAALFVSDGTGRTRVAVSTRGGAHLAIIDADGKERAQVGLETVNGLERPIVWLRDGAGAVRVSLTVSDSPVGFAEIQLNHRLTKDDAMLPELQHASIALQSIDGRPASISFAGYDGEELHSVP